jgi:hypothetical protein
MKQTINFYDFQQAFIQHDRHGSFSYQGLKALYNYLEELEEDTGEQYELDVISLCCDYSEYENLEDFHYAYDPHDYPDMDAISENTIMIGIDGGGSFIIQAF